MAKAEIEGGVIATPVPITRGSSVHIIYSGLLAEQGADCIYLHSGYGPSHSWGMLNDCKMEASKWGWEAVVDIRGQDRFNFCFRDSADNWDNNNGRNWSYQVHEGRRP